MRQLTYALRFTGRAVPVSAGVKIYRTMTTAPSSVFRTIVGSDGLHGTIESIEGAHATYEAETTLTGDGTFTEAGTIRFGEGHVLRFSTVGSGSFGPSADPALIQGTATFRVDGGDGQFAGASGLIICNFLETEQAELVDHHLGVLFLP
jgi:hypothetical protein